jgi:CheY-like chemotaxis protein
MVVEDEPDIYDVLLAMFGIWGIDGVAFVDGEEAIAWINDVDNGRFQGELPELALLDIRLPGEINGPAVGARLRKSPILRDIAIVLTTAYRLSPEEEHEVKENAGADRLIYKPLPKFTELQKLLEDTIATRRESASKAPQVKPEVAPIVPSAVNKPVEPVSQSVPETPTNPATSETQAHDPANIQPEEKA